MQEHKYLDLIGFSPISYSLEPGPSGEPSRTWVSFSSP